LKFSYLLFGVTGFFALLGPAAAQVQQNEQTTTLVRDVTEAFFDQLPKADFDVERAFMTDGFADQTPLSAWKAVRDQFVRSVGGTPRYNAHQLTYYTRETLLAAVDFSGQPAKPDTFICGFVLWEIPEQNKIGFIRLEQNVVEVPIFKSMPRQQAAQLMTDWYCPASLIETVLGSSGQ
jgi:hypothetical protein